MSNQVFEQYVDEHGNISVRVSQDMIVLTQEEAERIEAKYKRMQAENAKLRELVEDMLDCIDIQIAFERVPARWMRDEFAVRARKLGIEVTE